MHQVHAGSVLARDASVAWAALDGEVVIYVPASGRVQILSRTAGVLWECLDGVSPLGEIFADLADAYGVSLDVIEGDCMPTLTIWIEEGLVTEPSGTDSPAEPPSARSPEAVAGRWRRPADPPNA